MTELTTHRLRLLDCGLPPVAGIYRLAQPIGHGGMARVHAGHHIETRREVAIKLPRDDALTSFSGLLREARYARRIQHPNVVAILGYGIDRVRRIPFIVMPRIRGRTLRAVLEESGPLPVSRAVRLATELTRAVAACHVQNLAHRDIKPENALVSGRGANEHVTLIDFGLARFKTDGPQNRPAKVEGTLPYIALEQVHEPAVRFESDLFSLGCVLREMLTGAPPFDEPENWNRVTRPHRATFARPLDLAPTSNVAVDRQLRRLDSLLLHPDPAARPSSALEVMALLRGVREAVTAGPTAAAA